jgi:hypothetical protein
MGGVGMNDVVSVRFKREVPLGGKAASAWLSARGLEASPSRWNVLIALDTGDANETRFHLAIDGNEWGYCFVRGSGMSWIRVTTAPIVHERDDFGLLSQTPTLASIGQLIQQLEDRHQIQFDRRNAQLKTNLPGADHKIRLWIVASL